ncbi:MAG: alpha/beta hydrolase [bacterium]|nr:alpha/beta hydrolase [bacterium]
MTIWTDLTGIDFEVRTVEAAGVPTRALIAGVGPDVVFLHGTSGHLEAFSRNFVPHVAAGLRCHAIDALGHGYTGKPDYPYEIPRYVDHLVGYLDAMGIDRANLVGESLGGWTAGWLASERPERVRTLQLVAAGGTKANPEVMARIKSTTTRAALTDDIALTRDRLHLLMYDGERDVSEELTEIRYRIYHQPEFQANLHNLLCLQEMEIRQRNLMRPERLQRITAPTLIIWGSQNPFGDVPEARAMQENVSGSELRIFNNCGHWPQHEHADEFNPLSIDFITSHQ